MPANLPPEAKAKLAKYSDAKSIEEKIQALEEFLSAVPKHKGTENIRQWARRRLAELREELESRRRRRGGGGPRIFIEKAGAAQVVLVGPPNVGKSSLLQSLTNARAQVAPYPFSTTRPVPGMLQYEDIQFQLVDTPPLVLDQPDSPVNNRVIGLVRNADAVIIVVSLASDDPAGDLVRVLKFLEERGIVVTPQKGIVRVKKDRSQTGIRVILRGRMVGFTEDDLRRLLGQYRIYNAVVEIEGDVTLEDVEESLFSTRMYKPAVIAITHPRAKGARRKALRLKKVILEGVPVLVGDARSGRGFERLGEILFKTLRIIRIYTKQPNKEPDPNPLVLRVGATVIDAAKRIHKDLARKFKYAKIWGPSAKYPGQRVGASHVLADRDILEIHAD
ncbi:MAG: TGS domain-containing protein [Desulfurococcales archaeon]|nr:TGS domain-containing protein [Desulfurococcales archaeon]